MPLVLDRSRIRSNIRALQRTALATRAVDEDAASRPSSRASGVLTDAEPSPESYVDSTRHDRDYDTTRKAAAARSSADVEARAASASGRRARRADLPGVVALAFADTRHRYPVLATSIDDLKAAVRSVMVDTGRLERNDKRVAVPVAMGGPVDDALIESDEQLEEFLAGPHSGLLPTVTATLVDAQTAPAKAPPTPPAQEEVDHFEEPPPQPKKKAAPPPPSTATPSTAPPSPPSPPKPTMAEQAIETEPPTPRVSTACGPSGASPAESSDDASDALWHGTFQFHGAAKATIADLRLEAIEQYFAATRRGSTVHDDDDGDAAATATTAPQRRDTDELEITLRDSLTGKPLLLSRDVRRAAARTAEDYVAVEAFVFRAPSKPPTPQPQPESASPAGNDITEPPECPTPPADVVKVEESEADEPEEEPPKPEVRKATKPPATPPIKRRDSAAVQRPLIGLRGGAASPPENARAAGRAVVRVPITYLGTSSMLPVPVSRQPQLQDLVRDAIECFEPPEMTAELLPRASLSYVRAGVGVNARPSMVHMSEDVHVAGLVWEALERDRQGESLKDMELALNVRRGGLRNNSNSLRVTY